MKNLLLLLALSTSAFGYELPEGYEFVPEQKVMDDLQPLLINGRQALDGEYPEIVNIRTGNSLCTATIVGPRTILTAAHCANNGATSRFTFQGQTYEARITRSPLYPNPDHDIALGYLNREISVAYAVISGVPERGDRVTLTGYGCVRPGGGGGNDGILRVGDSSIIGFQGYDFVTRRDDGAALCFGDSGGPAYVYMTDAFVEVHQLMGVNSKGNIRDTSLLTRTDVTDSQDFFKSWAETNSTEICGVNLDCSGQPDPDPEPPQSCWERFMSSLAKLFDDLSGCTRAEKNQTTEAGSY